MERPTGLGKLQTGEWDALQEIADRFEEAWQKVADPQQGPDLVQFLPPPEDLLRPTALQELIKTDLEIRWRRRQTLGLEHYLEKYPELGPRQAVPVALLYEEYRVRQLYGDKPAVSAYQERFPEQFEALTRLVQQQPLPTLVTGLTQPGVVERPQAPVTGQQVVPSDSAGPAGPGKTLTNLVVVGDAPPAPPPKGTLASATNPLGGSSGLLSMGGGYNLIKRIGSGGFGEVWRADAPGGVPCAVKIIFRPLDHDEAQRERQSLELIKGLRHPYLLATTNFQPLDDRLVVVMELADGSLRDRLKECRKLDPPGIPLPELIRYFRESAEALDFLHQQHVLHRDIKPDNILMLQRHAKVADFGLARITEASMASASGSGTPAYMAPEVWRGKVSDRSDQYALAVTYAELRLDRRLYSSRDMMEIMLDHLERVPDLKPLPEAEQQVILRALAKEPEKRFGSCLEFVATLEDALAPQLAQGGGVRGSARPATIPEGPSLPGRGSMGATFPEGPGGLRPVSATGGGTELLHPPTAPDGTLKKRWNDATGGTVVVPERPSRRRFLQVLGGAVAAGGLGVAAALVAPRFFRKPDDKPDIPGGSGLATGQEPQPGSDVVADRVHLDPDKLNCVTNAEAKVYTDFKKYRLYTRIDFRYPDGTTLVPFVLVPQERPQDPPSFYIMKYKVTNDLFRFFAENHPDLVVTSDWQKGGMANRLNVGSGNPHHPVFRVTPEQAARFAEVMMRGRLPSALEWDKAAGEFDVGIKTDGPYVKEPPTKGKIAVDRVKQGPMEVGEAPEDESFYSCRDMAGDGREMTRTVQDADREIPLANPKSEDVVTLRGKSYIDTKPYEFRDHLASGALKYRDSQAYVSFRVVLDDLGLR
jgi:hypothetical protein